MSAPTLDVRRIRAVTLDLDDTLWPVWPTIEHAEGSLRAWLDAHAPRAGTLACNRDAASAARHAARAAHPHAVHDMTRMRREAIRHLLQAAGEDPALAEPAFEVFYAARQRVTLYDDALPALSALAARWPLVAVSNGNADVHRVGIGAHFHASVNAVSAGAAKPDARIFLAAAGAAGVAPEQVLHIGDSLALDVAGAQAVRMQTAWIRRPDHPPPDDPSHAQPDATTPDLLTLLNLLLPTPDPGR